MATSTIRSSFLREEMKSVAPEIVPYEVVKDEGFSRKPGFLESIGARILSLARQAVDKVEKLPYPVGTSVDLVEELVSPRMVSLSHTVESLTLQALAFADEQVEWLTNTVEKCFHMFRDTFDVSKHVLGKMVSMTTERVSPNYLVDYAANLLINYEIIVKNRTNSVLHLVLNLPGIGAMEHMRLEPVKEKSPVGVLEYRDMVESPSEMKKTPDKKVAMVEEISPVKEVNKKKVGKVVDEGDEEADELSKLIDASWCLGSPRRYM